MKRGEDILSASLLGSRQDAYLAYFIKNLSYLLGIQDRSTYHGSLAKGMAFAI
jgi:hypothetical protein